MDTKFAKAERSSREEILRQKEGIEGSDFLTSVLAQTPFMFLILNADRQVVFSNHLMLKNLGYSDLDDVIGFRPGEVFRCIHSDKEPGGCGTSESCRYCGAILTVLESAKSNQLEIGECIINIRHGQAEVPMNFEVASKPFAWNSEQFFVVTLQDIGDKKRKEQLERTFFHDIINKAGNARLFLEMLTAKKDQNDSTAMIDAAKKGLQDLLDDIQYQRKIQMAESNTLQIEHTMLNSRQLVMDVLTEYNPFAEQFSTTLMVDSGFTETTIKSDRIVFNRVLGNLVKNAVEACEPGDKVEINCRLENGCVVFSVYNPTVMPKDVQMQIFNRSFSTKGEGRGVGTYSIKMFTEKYLGGTVDFHSEERMGTVFYIRIPV